MILVSKLLRFNTNQYLFVTILSIYQEIIIIIQLNNQYNGKSNPYTLTNILIQKHLFRMATSEDKRNRSQ